MKKKVIITSFIAFPVIAGLYYFIFLMDSDPGVSSPATNFIVKREMPLRRGELRVTVSATGVISPINVIEVKSKASGIVEQIPIENSDRIRTGQLIARLDQTDTRNAYDQALADSQVAVATLTQQENNWKRANDLYQKQLISQQDFDQINVDFVKSKSSLVKAQSSLILARQKLAETIVLSPINGIVLSRNVTAGQIIASAVSNVGGGTTIARVANMDEVHMIAAVDEVDIGRIAIGQETKIIADAYPDDVFYGRVIRIAAQSTVTQNVTTFDVVILVPNKNNKLKSGMNGTITIDIFDKEDVLLISNELLREYSEVQTDMKILKDAGVDVSVFSGRSSERKNSDSSKTTPKKDSRREKKTNKSDLMKADSGGSGIQPKKKFVVVRETEKLILRPVEIGAANFDEAEVVSGLTDSTKVYMVKFSQAKQESQERKDMLKNRMGGGMGPSRRN